MDAPGPVLRTVLAAPAYLYRWRLGWLLGHRFLLLSHRGRGSGRTHRVVLEVVQYNASNHTFVVMSGFGARAQWLRNVEAGGALRIDSGRQRFRPSWRRLDENEAAAVFAGYERRNRLAAPVVRWVLSRLLGWRYDSTPEARLRLVREKPLIAFAPRH